MMKLYDEIMNIPVPSFGDDRYIDGMNRGIELAAELVKNCVMIKLYIFEPRGHGSLSFFVMAETEEEAFRLIDSEIERRLKLKPRDNDYIRNHLNDYACSGWGTEYYDLSVIEPGMVFTHTND